MQIGELDSRCRSCGSKFPTDFLGSLLVRCALSQQSSIKLYATCQFPEEAQVHVLTLSVFNLMTTSEAGIPSSIKSPQLAQTRNQLLVPSSCWIEIWLRMWPTYHRCWKNPKSRLAIRLKLQSS